MRNLCRHEGALIDGWKLCCDAFPDEILRRFDYGSVKERKDWNDGIEYEEGNEWKIKNLTGLYDEKYHF